MPGTPQNPHARHIPKTWYLPGCTPSRHATCLRELRQAALRPATFHIEKPGGIWALQLSTKSIQGLPRGSYW
eukprot:364960-Chlamydomonas_euryale.AAC.4